MRLDKFLSNLKYGSRTEVKGLINNGLVRVNNTIITSEKHHIDELDDKVYVNDNLVFYKYPINLVLNKPLGYLSANKDNLHKTVIELIKEPYNRFDFKIAGRLDLDSSGLLILTTSGSFAHLITNPNSKLNKVYEVTLESEITDYEVLLKGVTIKDGKNEDYLAVALDIVILESNKVLITIDEGKFHQVRRMFRYINNEVTSLKRVKIGNLELTDLEEGTYKEFERSDLL